MHISIGETENSGRASRAAQIPVPSANGAKLKNGDVIIAAVERIEGDTLTLRASDGTLLRAALQAGLSLAQGDVIEALADRSGERCLLHMLNVSRGGAAAADGEAQTVSQPVLSGMLSMMKQNPGMEADTARFFAKNNIPASAENLAALAQLSEGDGIGALLGRILGFLAPPDEALAPSAATFDDGTSAPDTPTQQDGVNHADPGAQRSRSETTPSGQAGEAGGAPEAVQTGNGVPESAQAPDRAPEGAQAGSIVPEKTQTAGSVPEEVNNATAPAGAKPQDAAAQSHQTDAQPRDTVILDTSAKETDDASRAMPDSVRQAETPKDQPLQRNHVQTSAATAQGKPEAVAQGRLSARIGGLIRSIFVRPDALTGEQVKKSARDIPETLGELKYLLVRSDIKNKEPCLEIVDQALRQMELAERDVRFEHMQVPVYAKNGAHQTAELYVFRHLHKRQESGGAGFSILVALDTRYIGRVEALIRETDGNISLEFRLEQAEAAQMFKRSAESLEQAVQTAGYRLTGMRFTGLEKRTTVLNAGETISTKAGRAPQGIDVKI
jgi:hypothetical protein